MQRNDTKRFYLMSVAVIVAAACLGWQPAKAGADWKDRWEAAVKGGQQEGKVVVFGPPGDAVRQALTQGFQQAFPGINLEYSGASGGQTAAKMRSERDAGIYSVDVVLSGTTTAIVHLKPMGALDSVKAELLLPEVTDGKYWLNQSLEFADAAGMYDLVFITNVNTPIAYNLEQVKPEDINEPYKLLDLKWKGKIVISDPLPPGPSSSTFRLIWREFGPEKAEDFYRKIRLQAALVDRDSRRDLEWVAQGKYPILLGANSTIAQVLLKRGLKFGVLAKFADIGGTVTPSFGSLMVVNKRPHPNAATVFTNWILSKEGQTTWSKANFDASRRVDVPTDHLPSFRVPTASGKYWWSYYEKDVHRSKKEETILKELFGR